jgi:hypothetical protein
MMKLLGLNGWTKTIIVLIEHNTNNWKSKGSSRSSHSGIVLSPITTSNIDEAKLEAVGHTRHLSKEDQLIYERA